MSEKDYMTTFEVTIPTSVVENLDCIVSHYDEGSGEINRNGVISYLIQRFYVEEGFYDEREGLEGEDQHGGKTINGKTRYGERRRHHRVFGG